MIHVITGLNGGPKSDLPYDDQHHGRHDASKGENMKDLKAKAISLMDIVDYQKGSVVSREIVSKKTGTLTLFAFDTGQGLSEHTAPFDATVYCLEGEVEVTISGNPILLKGGEMIIMPANEPHALQAVTPFKMLLIMIRA